MKKSTTAMALALAAIVSGCGEDVTTSDEYQALEQEIADLEQQLSEATSEGATSTEVPAEVAAVLDEWWAANERGDGSVVELYRPTGYHLYGEERIDLDQLAAHLSGGGGANEWITEPILIAAEPEGRYVVTRGVRIGSGGRSTASALTFEIQTSADGELEIVHTDWTYGSD